MKAASLAELPQANRFARRRERTRQELLTAATTVLARQGIRATKIADIAAEADVGVGTFYLHFETKEALVDAVVQDVILRFKAAVDAARDAATDPLARIRNSTAAACGFARDHRELFKIVFGADGAHHELVRRAQALFAVDIEDNLRAGIEAGVLAPMHTALAAQALVGMITQLLAWWSEHEAVPIEWLEDTINHLSLHGTLRQPVPPV
jgi:AcrR family transcriptional regulator